MRSVDLQKFKYLMIYYPCAVYTNKLLLYAHWTLAIGYCMHSAR